jgi:hypothetical protein
VTVTCQLRMPSMAHLLDHIRYNAPFAKKMATADSRIGKTVNIYGAGPSLSDIPVNPICDEAWACNSALVYLKEARPDVRITHGFCIDQGVEMLKEWSKTFNVRYLVSSSINPKLTDHLTSHKRKLTFFHNFLGAPNSEGYTGEVSEEMSLYQNLYRTSIQVGHGLNAVPRDVCLALAMGFKTIRVYGADCAASPDYIPMPDMESGKYQDWLKGLVLYADGRNALDCYGPTSPFCEAPDLNGRRWHTRPDMVVSAQHLLDLQRIFPGRIELAGDTLPNAIREVASEDLPQLTPAGEVIGFGQAA